jgi:hypothetical protein
MSTACDFLYFVNLVVYLNLHLPSGKSYAIANAG